MTTVPCCLSQQEPHDRLSCFDLRYTKRGLQPCCVDCVNVYALLLSYRVAEVCSHRRWGLGQIQMTLETRLTVCQLTS